MARGGKRVLTEQQLAAQAAKLIERNEKARLRQQDQRDMSALNARLVTELQAELAATKQQLADLSLEDDPSTIIDQRRMLETAAVNAQVLEQMLSERDHEIEKLRAMIVRQQFEIITRIDPCERDDLSQNFMRQYVEVQQELGYQLPPLRNIQVAPACIDLEDEEPVRHSKRKKK